MTQHEYVFVAVSIILGLGLTRLLHTVAQLIRRHREVEFHWATALWGLCVLVFVLQLWWVGWGLRDMGEWVFLDFLMLVFGCICIFGAAEMALPVPGESSLVMQEHSKSIGRLSALSLLAYFGVGPYLNISMLGNPVLPSLVVPGVGGLLMVLVMARPQWFSGLSLAFAAYSLLLVLLTA